MVRPRGSSNLGADPRGDTSGPAISTLERDLSHDERENEKDRLEKIKKPHSKRRKAKSLFRRWKSLSLRHTWLNPLILTLLILSAYAVSPGEHNPLHQAIFISYNEGPSIPGGPNKYGKGRADLAFVGFYIIVLSFTREFFMQRVIRPLAVRAGIKKRAKQSRFMEQVYTAMYFAIFGPFGLYVMKNAEGGKLWYFATTSMFEGFPHRSHDGIFKTYYLLQAAYWAQQAIVLLLGLEAPRKDFYELVLHHVITLALIGLSYRFHFALMGIAVFITHDISDFFLATSKTLNYIDSIIVGPYFLLFIGVWVYLRHYINLCILWATLTEFKTVGPYELNWETQQYKCWISQVITFGLLASLQAVNSFWLFLILRIAKNYVFNTSLADERSDNEDTDDEPASKSAVTNGTVKQQIESAADKMTETPSVLLNGQPMKSEPAADGPKLRRSPRKG